MQSLPIRRKTSSAMSSSASTPAKHCLVKYSLGRTGSVRLTVEALSSWCSSMRHSQNGSQLQLPSRNANRSPGKRSQTPPATMARHAYIASMG